MYDKKRAERYVKFLMQFFDSLTLQNYLEWFFCETEYNKKDINFQYEHFLIMYTPVYEKLKYSLHVRLNQIDYWGSLNFTPLHNFAVYILSIHSK